jgi:hypothetical protein
MNQMPSMNRAAVPPTAGASQPNDPKLGSGEAQPGASRVGPGPAVTAHLSPAPATSDPAVSAAALRDLAMKLAEVAADGG